jgi:hypothetical protein
MTSDPFPSPARKTTAPWTTKVGCLLARTPHTEYGLTAASIRRSARTASARSPRRRLPAMSACVRAFSVAKRCCSPVSRQLRSPVRETSENPPVAKMSSPKSRRSRSAPIGPLQSRALTAGARLLPMRLPATRVCVRACSVQSASCSTRESPSWVLCTASTASSIAHQTRSAHLRRLPDRGGTSACSAASAPPYSKECVPGVEV